MVVNVVPPSVLTCHCTVSAPPGFALAVVKVTLWPALTVWLAGCVVTESTVRRRRIAVERALAVGEHGLVLVAVLRSRRREVVRERSCAGNVGERRAAIGAHLPLHRVRAAGVGAGGREVTLWPVLTVWLAGCVVTESTVKVAADVVAVPTLLVKTALYSSPLCDAVAVNVYVVDVAPEMSVNVVPPSVLTSHCTVGVGVPLAAAVKVAVAARVDGRRRRIGGHCPARPGCRARW